MPGSNRLKDRHDSVSNNRPRNLLFNSTSRYCTQRYTLWNDTLHRPCNCHMVLPRHNLPHRVIDQFRSAGVAGDDDRSAACHRLVTHFMEEAERLCDRLAIFDAGHVIAQGTPEQIIADHAESASVSFTPNRETPGIERCPGVRHISSLDGRTLIEGSPDMVAYVCAELVRQGPPPTDLRIVQPNLEDAVLAIEDRSRA